MSKKGLFQPVVLGTILAIGFGLVWALVAEWALAIISAATSQSNPTESLVFLVDGTPCLQRSTGEATRYYDLEGNLLSGAGEKILCAAFTTMNLPAALPTRSPRGEVSWSDRIQFISDGGNPMTYWYFVSDGQLDGTGYFVGYDVRSKFLCRLPGHGRVPRTAAASGRASPGPQGKNGRAVCAWRRGLQRVSSTPPQQFPPGRRPTDGSLAPWDVYVVGRQGSVYHVDLQDRTVHLILEDPQLRSAQVFVEKKEQTREGIPWLALRVGETILVTSAQGTEKAHFPIPEALSRRTLEFMETSRGEGLMFSTRPYNDETGTWDFDIAWVTPAGQTRDRTVALKMPGSSSLGMVLSALMDGLMVPVPGALCLQLGTRVSMEEVEGGEAKTYQGALTRELKIYWPSMVFAQLIAVVFAVLCYRRQVR